jgi:hypothetical protein
MNVLSKYIGEDLILIQPSLFKREYEFRSSNELLARMYFPSLFSLTAVVEGFEEKYEIIKPSFWKADIAIRKHGYDMTFASLTTNFFRTKGSIDLQNGKKLNLKFGAFKKSCQVFSESEELLIMFQNRFSFKQQNIVTIQKLSALVDENPWVVMMVWYQVIQRNRRNN